MRRVTVTAVIWLIIWIAGSWLLDHITSLNVGAVVAFFAGMLAAIWYWQRGDTESEET